MEGNIPESRNLSFSKIIYENAYTSFITLQKYSNRRKFSVLDLFHKVL